MDTNELIERYLDGEASKEELAELKKLMANDAKLKKEVATQRLMKGILKSERKTAFESELMQLSADILKPKMGKKQETNEPATELKQEKAKVRSLFPQRFAMAAAAAVALIIVSVFVFQGPQTDVLYADFYQPFSVKSVRGDSNNNLEGQIADTYNQEDYNAAKQLINQYLKDSPDQANRFELLLANCHLNLNQTDQAITILTKLIQRSGNKYVEDAEWYLVLAHLKADNAEAAKKVLNTISSNENHIYKTHATRLLKKL